MIRNWQNYAACLGVQEAKGLDFVEVGKGAEGEAHVLTCRVYCDSCPVRSECLTFGVRTRSYGIWGGVARPLGDSWRTAIAKARRDGYSVPGMPGSDDTAATEEASQRAEAPVRRHGRRGPRPVRVRQAAA